MAFGKIAKNLIKQRKIHSYCIHYCLQGKGAVPTLGTAPFLIFNLILNRSIPFLAARAAEAVLAGKVDVVLVNSLDHLGRDWCMTKQYIDLLTKHKVKLLCVRNRMIIENSSFSLLI